MAPVGWDRTHSGWQAGGASRETPSQNLECVLYIYSEIDFFLYYIYISVIVNVEMM